MADEHKLTGLAGYAEQMVKTETVDYDAVEKRFIPLKRLNHHVQGLVTESAEALDQLKKHLHYNKEFDPQNMREELGDILWYLQGALLALNELTGDVWTLDDIADANIRKLQARYGDKFDTEKAVERDTTAEMAAHG